MRAAVLSLALGVMACRPRDPYPQPYPQQPYPQQPYAYGPPGYYSPYPAPPSSPQAPPVAPPPASAGATFARYARLDRASCEAELARRGVAYVRAAETFGVLAPVRLRGPLNGVSIHSGLAVAQRDKSPYEVFDCRLVLALHDFAAVLAARGVVDVTHLSAYRSQAENGCTPRYVGKQHCAALAVDVGYFKRSDGVVLNVDKDFNGRVGQETCSGASAPNPATPAATELWGFVCEATRRTLFNVILTPNYNAQHKNHLHLEVTPDADWMLIR